MSMMSKRLVISLTTMGFASTMMVGCGPVQQGSPGSLSTLAQATSSAEAVVSESTDAAAQPQDGGGAPADPAPTEHTDVSSGSSGTQPPTSEPGTADPTAAPGSATTGSQGAGSGHDQSQAQIDGWSINFLDDFDVPLEQTQWERYGWGDPPVGHGAMGVMSQRNSFTRDGCLVIRTQYDQGTGQWSAGGASSKYVYTASYGRWEVRAKFPQAKGIGYAFLLWPADEGWPPEIDFAEGRVNGPQVMGVYHWDPDNKQEHRFYDNDDMSGWHTYGVIVEPNRITFTIDGQPWGTIEHPSVTDKRLFIGFQTGAMDPGGWQSSTETVDGGVPGPLTPAISDIEIDYVAHYTKN